MHFLKKTVNGFKHFYFMLLKNKLITMQFGDFPVLLVPNLIFITFSVLHKRKTIEFVGMF